MRMAMVATATFLLFAIVYSLLSTITGVQNDHQDSDFTGKQALLHILAHRDRIFW